MPLNILSSVARGVCREPLESRTTEFDFVTGCIEEMLTIRK